MPKSLNASRLCAWYDTVYKALKRVCQKFSLSFSGSFRRLGRQTRELPIMMPHLGLCSFRNTAPQARGSNDEPVIYKASNNRRSPDQCDCVVPVHTKPAFAEIISLGEALPKLSGWVEWVRADLINGPGHAYFLKWRQENWKEFWRS